MESVPLTWEEVARVYGRKIYNFAYRLTGNSDDAADLVQEVLLRVRKGL
ncbi:MAG: polymerase sigma factor, sigma-70 family, partial [Acidimicrobiia bacterium]|nr:polymerase sigma factor, sigma-70 family [Acidimicrobiia bacterium]